MTEVASATTPVILHQGRYRLYEKPDGTIRIQYRRDDKDADDYFELPGHMVRLAKAASEGTLTPGQMIAEVMRFINGKPT